MSRIPETDSDPLDDFDPRETEIDGITKRVYVAGCGPPVIVMPEMPGISPQVARFARWVRDDGFTVYLPSLFGRDGATPDAAEGAKVFRAACVSAEFRALGSGASSPVANWLRGLARQASGDCGGLPVGAVGMCFTGNFALSMMLEPMVRAPVLCQPSLPLDEPGGLEISSADLERISARLEREDLTVRAYRFEGDRFCQDARFAAYRTALGDRFEGTVLSDEAANLEAQPPFFAEHVRCPHSVVTVNLVDEEGEPTRKARDEILQFLRWRLRWEE